jgi:DNA-binding NarL/FixJ family response regulator
MESERMSEVRELLLAAVRPKSNGYDSTRAEIAEEIAAIRAALHTRAEIAEEIAAIRAALHTQRKSS